MQREITSRERGRSPRLIPDALTNTLAFACVACPLCGASLPVAGAWAADMERSAWTLYVVAMDLACGTLPPRDFSEQRLVFLP